MKRTIKTKIITACPDKKLPVNDLGVFHKSVLMTAQEALDFKVKQFKKDKTLLNFNAEITVLLSRGVEDYYWTLSISVTKLFDLEKFKIEMGDYFKGTGYNKCDLAWWLKGLSIWNGFDESYDRSLIVFHHAEFVLIAGSCGENTFIIK